MMVVRVRQEQQVAAVAVAPLRLAEAKQRDKRRAVMAEQVMQLQHSQAEHW
jgi:hypothetical protein